MEFNPLTAISPIDGRYSFQVRQLAPFFSEFGLIKFRIFVEIEYFISLCKIPLLQLEKFPSQKFEALKGIYTNFSLEDATEIKDIEKSTNHDVKAVEYFLKKRFTDLGLEEYVEFIHFGLTSQDINNTATPLLLKEALEEVFYPVLNDLVKEIGKLSSQWKDVPMLAKTHGQPASPTTVGKEFMVFQKRVENQMALLKTIPFSAKFGGATGNLNAHQAAFPEINWAQFVDRFVEESLGLTRSHPTTQIEHYDNLAALFDNLKRINTILIDFSRDIWHYISMNYLKQGISEGEVGSSTMPHKVNPIDFENAEGNLGLANAIFIHLSSKLPISRLQRDLTDSTVLRNIGVPLCHSLISFKSILKGLGKIELNQEVISQDLEQNWVVVAEGIQTILRREGYPEPYEALKKITRNNKPVTKEDMEEFIDALDLNESVKKELKNLTPFNYTGIT